MFWNTPRSNLRLSLPARLVWIATAFIFFSTTAMLGSWYFPVSPANEIFWSVWLGIFIGMCASTPLRAWLTRARFRKTVAKAFDNCGPERNALTSAAVMIGCNAEVRALQILAHAKASPPGTPGAAAREWLEPLAGAHWIARQSPFETLPGSVERFPQIHALIYSHSVARTPLRMKALSEELAAISSQELDSYARGYMALTDALINTLGDTGSPFANDAPELLAMLTGHSNLLGARERVAAWWAGVRPLYARGGGALLASIRLLQRADFTDTAKLLERFAADGMLSRECDTLRRAARFLALFSIPQWHMSGADIPRYFEHGMYHQWAELGVFRYPTAEMSEVAACCARGKIYRDAKRRLIEEALHVWTLFGDDLAEPMCFLLRKLLEDRSRQTSSRLEFWRMKWEVRKKLHDKDVQLLMDGIVCINKQDWRGALKLFAQAASLDPSSSVPLVNSVFVMLKRGQREEAKKLIKHIHTLHPRDGQALLALGRLLAIHADDPKEAEALFLKALNLLDPATEALYYLGELKFMDGKLDESQFYFEQARQMSPEQPRPKLGLARVLGEMGRAGEAVEILKEVVRDGPNEARDEAYFMLYRTLREAGQDRASLEYLNMLPARFFTDPDLIDDIAVHLESEKMYAKAREFAERAMLLRASGKGRNDDPDALGMA